MVDTKKDLTFHVSEVVYQRIWRRWLLNCEEKNSREYWMVPARMQETQRQIWSGWEIDGFKFTLKLKEPVTCETLAKEEKYVGGCMFMSFCLWRNKLRGKLPRFLWKGRSCWKHLVLMKNFYEEDHRPFSPSALTPLVTSNQKELDPQTGKWMRKKKKKRLNHEGVESTL